MNKKGRNLIISMGLLIAGYFFGDTISKINESSPVKIPETVEEVNALKIPDFYSQEPEESRTSSQNNQDSNHLLGNGAREWDKMETATVKYIIDGDTIILTNGEKVRYTSINTPERGQCWYKQAKKMNQDLVSGKEVLLEQDISNRDKYERLLRYIYIKSEETSEDAFQFVNMELVRAGLARVREYKPDIAYIKELEAVEKYAKENKVGLWGGCEE